MLSLSTVRSDSVDAVYELLDGFSLDAPPAEMGQQVSGLCRHLRNLAAAGLLIDGDPLKYATNLGRAGANWISWLRHAAKKGWELPPISDMDPIIGAVAAGQWDLAGEAAVVCRGRPRCDLEYPGEHAFAEMFLALVANADDHRTVAGSACERLAGSDMAGDAERAALGQALLEGNQKDFFAALSTAAVVQEQATEMAANSFVTDWRGFAAERYLWYEGIAWLRLGVRAGWQRVADVPLCPALAVDFKPPAFVSDLLLIKP